MSNSSLPPVAPTLTYSFRRSIYVPERTYHLGLDSIDWQDEREKGSLAYADIRRVRVYDIPSSMFRTLRCVLQSRAGQTTVLDATHYLGFNSTEDRSASYLPFARELLAGIAAANTQTDFIMGHHWALWLFWLVIFIGSLFVLCRSRSSFFSRPDALAGCGGGRTRGALPAGRMAQLARRTPAPFRSKGERKLTRALKKCVDERSHRRELRHHQQRPHQQKHYNDRREPELLALAHIAPQISEKAEHQIDLFPILPRNAREE
jgi:hypothetical protein